MTSMNANSAERARWLDRLGAAPQAFTQGSPLRRGSSSDGAQINLQVSAFGSTVDAVLLLPTTLRRQPPPVVIVPFYDVETLIGLRSELYPLGAHPTKAFAREVAARGIAALAVPWWAEVATRPNAARDLEARYGDVTRRHLDQFPAVTGLGRSVVEIRLLVDALGKIEEVDSSSIGMLGHSLGAKLTLFCTALDPRIKAAFAHEPGLGFSHSNWGAPWYFGRNLPHGRDLDELVALIAPRPLLYAGGGEFDGPQNAELIARIRHLWPDGDLVVRMHEGGHPLPESELHFGIDWLKDQLSSDH